jgi:hypothetical protein
MGRVAFDVMGNIGATDDPSPMSSCNAVDSGI